MHSGERAIAQLFSCLFLAQGTILMLNLWYKNAIIYCIDVKIFMDANGDGIGDFAGLTQRVNYLSELGVICIWLMPFYPSPNKDNDYDVMDYYSVDPRLGTLGDFVGFTRRAKERGMGFWLVLGVSGYRIDAAPYFIELRQADNLIEPVDDPYHYIDELRDFLSWRQGDAILLGKVNEPPEQLPKYFGNGDRMQMLFNFWGNQHLMLALAQEKATQIITTST